MIPGDRYGVVLIFIGVDPRTDVPLYRIEGTDEIVAILRAN